MEERRPSWSDVEAVWEDPTAHDRFVEACRTSDNLRYAAECYRQRLLATPDDPVALKRQKQLVALAMMSINLETAKRHALRDDEPAKGNSRLPLFLALIGAALGGLAGYLLSSAAPAALPGGMTQAIPLAITGGLAGLVLGLVVRRRTA